jgi:hypothetical protein
VSISTLRRSPDLMPVQPRAVHHQLTYLIAMGTIRSW